MVFKARIDCLIVRLMVVGYYLIASIHIVVLMFSFRLCLDYAFCYSIERYMNVCPNVMDFF